MVYSCVFTLLYQWRKLNTYQITTLREPPVNRKDLQAVTLVEPPRDNRESDPLAVLHLSNRLFINAIIKSCVGVRMKPQNCDCYEVSNSSILSYLPQVLLCRIQSFPYFKKAFYLG